MPLTIVERNDGGPDFASPFIGPTPYTAPLIVDLTALTAFEIDTKGFLKPGVPFDSAGVLIAVTEAVHGVVAEAIQFGTGNDTAALAAMPAAATVMVVTIGQVNRAIVEDILGRALTADEIAGFALASSLVKLIE